MIIVQSISHCITTCMSLLLACEGVIGKGSMLQDLVVVLLTSCGSIDY